DVEELVAVQREDGAVLLTARRGEPEPAAAAERLLLADGLDLRAETGERVDERLLLARAARNDDARDAGGDEAADAVLRGRKAGDRQERLGESLRRFSEPFRLAARKEQRLHQRLSSGSGAACGSGGDAWRGRPMPS